MTLRVISTFAGLTLIAVGVGAAGESLHGLALVSLEAERPLDAAGERIASFRVSALGLEGRGPTGRFVGDFLTVSNTEGYSSARLYAWWAQLAGGAWSVRGLVAGSTRPPTTEQGRGGGRRSTAPSRRG